MARQLQTSHSPVGFLLAEESDAVLRRFGRVYHGLDRLPLLDPPDTVCRDALGLPPLEDQSLKELLDEWFHITMASPFVQSAETAFRLLVVSRSFGFRVELLFCYLAWGVGDQRPESCPQYNEDPPTGGIMCGYDVSWPWANHSAILQPGVVPQNPEWLEKLNARGLLSSYADAVQLRTEYLKVYPYPPFEIFAVHLVPEIQISTFKGQKR